MTNITAKESLDLTEQELQWLEENQGNSFTLVTEDSSQSKYFTDINGVLKGDVLDFAKLVEKHLGIRIQIVPFSNISELVTSISEDTYDLYYGPFDNDFRRQFLNFCTPKDTISYKLITYDKNINTIYDLQNLSIGFIKNDYIVEKLYEKISVFSSDVNSTFNTDVKYYDSRDELEKALLDNEVSAIIQAYISSKEISINANIINLDEFTLPKAVISVNKDYPELYTILNKLIISDYYNYTEIYTLNNSDFQVNEFKISLTDEEKEWFFNNPIIYYEHPNDLKPLLFKNGDKFDGVIANYLYQMSENMGITIKPLENDTNVKTLSLFNIHNQNGDEYNYSYSYFPFSITILSNQPNQNIISLHGIENSSVALFKNDPFVSYLTKYHPSIELHLFDSIEDAFSSVNNGKSDYTVNNKYVAEYYLSKYNYRKLYNSGTINHDYGYIMKSNDEIFNQILDKYVLYNNLINKIDNSSINVDTTNYLLILAIALPLLIFSLLISYLYLHLKLETIKRIKVEKQEKIINEKFENILLSIIESLERATAYSDEDTGQHTRRIASYCEFMAQQLGYSDSDIKEITNYSQLHDIGKIGISESILKKPGKLTNEEYEEIKKHVNIGYDMIKPLDLGELAENIILYHHERWDGNGYLGLSGNEIPLESLIVVLADSYDAMRMKRVYKSEMTHLQAVEEIKNNSGLQFAPGIVNLFLTYHEEFSRIYEENL